MFRRVLIPLAALAGVLAASLALVSAPAPTRPVPDQLYSGRWYEIARIPNQMQRDCQGPTSDFVDFTGGAFRVVQACHHGAPTGPVQTWRASGRILPASINARMRLSFMGGIVNQEYWILDRAEDGSWAIMATPGGNYVWLLSRRPTIDPATRARLVTRIGQFGYPISRLQFPAQAG